MQSVVSEGDLAGHSLDLTALVRNAELVVAGAWWIRFPEADDCDWQLGVKSSRMRQSGSRRPQVDNQVLEAASPKQTFEAGRQATVVLHARAKPAAIVGLATASVPLDTCGHVFDAPSCQSWPPRARIEHDPAERQPQFSCGASSRGETRAQPHLPHAVQQHL